MPRTTQELLAPIRRAIRDDADKSEYEAGAMPTGLAGRGDDVRY